MAEFERSESPRIFAGHIDLTPGKKLRRSLASLAQAWRDKADVSVIQNGNVYFGSVLDVDHSFRSVTLQVSVGQVRLRF